MASTRMMPVVLVALLFSFGLFIVATLIQYERQLDKMVAEGPYLKEKAGKCICK